MTRVRSGITTEKTAVVEKKSSVLRELLTPKKRIPGRKQIFSAI